MATHTLKPCPFCGGNAELLIVPGKMAKWIVTCTKCYTNNGTFATDDDAREVWNRRVFEPLVNISEEVRRASHV